MMTRRRDAAPMPFLHSARRRGANDDAAQMTHQPSASCQGSSGSCRYCACCGWPPTPLCCKRLLLLECGRGANDAQRSRNAARQCSAAMQRKTMQRLANDDAASCERWCCVLRMMMLRLAPCGALCARCNWRSVQTLQLALCAHVATVKQQLLASPDDARASRQRSGLCQTPVSPRVCVRACSRDPFLWHITPLQPIPKAAAAI